MSYAKTEKVKDRFPKWKEEIFAAKFRGVELMFYFYNLKGKEGRRQVRGKIPTVIGRQLILQGIASPLARLAPGACRSDEKSDQTGQALEYLPCTAIAWLRCEVDSLRYTHAALSGV